MIIPLNQFELHINETILERGFAIFNKDGVQDISVLEDGKFKAIVTGNSDYEVIFEKDELNILSYRCACSYNYGPVCKHVVAVIFYLQQEHLNLSLPKPKIPKKKRSSKPKPKVKAKIDYVGEILNTITVTELQDFLREECKKHKDLETRFIVKFSEHSMLTSREFYQKQIKEIVKKALGRDKFIFNSGTRSLVNSLKPLQENAKEALHTKAYEKCFKISSALAEEMTKNIYHVDDSAGVFSDLISETTILLEELSKKPLEEQLRKDILSYCLDVLKKKVYEDFIWHIETIRIATSVANTKEEANEISKILDDLIYDAEEGKMLKLKLIKDFGTKKELELYICNNMSSVLVREYIIELAIQDGDFEKAIELCEEGLNLIIDADISEKAKWYDWLLRIAQAQNNKVEIIKYARSLFYNNWMCNTKYFAVLKITIPYEEWKDYVDDLILEIQASKNRWTYSLLSFIFIEEAYWAELLALVLTNLSLDSLKANEIYLAPHYPEEYIKLYEKEIYAYVGVNIGRPSYRLICRFLKRMNKLGGQLTVQEMIEKLREKYPLRTALLDELNKI